MVYQLESPDINTVINYCKDLCANDKIEVYDSGGKKDLVLHIYKDEDFDQKTKAYNLDTIIVLETENDNDMREEIQARFDAALEDGKDELDVYSEMLETGIDIKMVRKYLGDDAADHMKDFCKEHGLI